VPRRRCCPSPGRMTAGDAARPYLTAGHGPPRSPPPPSPGRGRVAQRAPHQGARHVLAVPRGRGGHPPAHERVERRAVGDARVRGGRARGARGGVSLDDGRALARPPRRARHGRAPRALVRREHRPRADRVEPPRRRRDRRARDREHAGHRPGARRDAGLHGGGRGSVARPARSRLARARPRRVGHGGRSRGRAVAGGDAAGSHARRVPGGVDARRRRRAARGRRVGPHEADPLAPLARGGRGRRDRGLGHRRRAAPRGRDPAGPGARRPEDRLDAAPRARARVDAADREPVPRRRGRRAGRARHRAGLSAPRPACGGAPTAACLHA
jgi:hypothetical protein